MLRVAGRSHRVQFTPNGITEEHPWKAITDKSRMSDGTRRQESFEHLPYISNLERGHSPLRQRISGSELAEPGGTKSPKPHEVDASRDRNGTDAPQGSSAASEPAYQI